MLSGPPPVQLPRTGRGAGPRGRPSIKPVGPSPVPARAPGDRVRPRAPRGRGAAAGATTAFRGNREVLVRRGRAGRSAGSRGGSADTPRRPHSLGPRRRRRGASVRRRIAFASAFRAAPGRVRRARRRFPPDAATGAAARRRSASSRLPRAKAPREPRRTWICAYAGESAAALAPAAAASSRGPVRARVPRRGRPPLADVGRRRPPWR